MPMLPGANSLRGPLSCLSEARYGIVWGAVGAARACLEAALDYTASRVAFGRPVSARQIVQQELVEMHVAVNNGLLLATRIGHLKDAGLVHARAHQLRQVFQRADGHRRRAPGAGAARAQTGSRSSTRSCAISSTSSRF